MLLSIGMIVKNEEKYLERCLSALRPILERVDCELIISDTGSSDKTVEIAARYTDNVFSFKWVNDFAAARNSTIECASGDWFMFIDADEIFVSCEDLIDFFNSGEYKEYNSATYIIRSLYTGGVHSDFDAHRLTKRLEKTEFVGIVHEQLNTFGDPIKRLTDVAEHYGYLSENKTSENKFKRNSELLLKKLKIQGDSDPLIYLQLYECYYLHDRAVAEQYLDQGIVFCEKYDSVVLVALYCHKAHLHYFDKEYNDVLDICERYFNMSTIIRSQKLTTDAEMYAFMASSMLALGRYDEAVSAYRSFFETYHDIKTGSLHTGDANMLVYYLASDNSFSVALYEFLKAGIASGNCHAIANALHPYSLNDFDMSPEHVEAIAGLFLRLMNDCSDIADFETLWIKYAELGEVYVRSRGTKDDLFPDSIRAALEARNAVELKKQKKYKDCATVLNDISAFCSEAAPASEKYKRIIAEEAEKSIRASEFQRLAAQIKNNISMFISAGNLASAERTLSEYKQLVPDDPDIVTLCEKIGINDK